MSNDALYAALEVAVADLGVRLARDPEPHNAAQHLHAASQPVEAILKKYPILPTDPQRMVNQGNGTLGLHYSTFDKLLVTVAVERGPQDAVTWMEKILTLKSADIRCVALLTGVSTAGAISLGHGVDILPVDQLPSSQKTSGMLSLCMQPTSRWFGLQPSAALISTVTVCPFLVEARPARRLTSPKSSDDRLAPAEWYAAFNAQEKMKEVCLALTLSSNAGPTIALQWNEFVDSDLAFFPTGFFWPSDEIASAAFSPAEEIRTEALPATQAYLAMHGSNRDRFDLALRRLNQAARRRDVGDIILDLAIAIEGLLAGEESGEISYRFALRAALILGTDSSERREIRKCMKEFYSYRSKMVHSGSIKEKDQPAALRIANKSTTYIRQILTKLILHGSIPKDWGDLEIGAATI